MNTRTDFPALRAAQAIPGCRYTLTAPARWLPAKDANTLALAIEGWLALDCCRVPDVSLRLVRAVGCLDHCEECGEALQAGESADICDRCWEETL